MAKKIVILGGGFAGLAVAQTLERRLRPNEADVTLICRDNYVLFTPMLPEVSSGTIETRHIVTPLRAELRHTNIVLGEVTKVDIPGRTVTVVDGINNEIDLFPYDHVVFALGAVNSTFGLPGVAEHTIPLKRLEDGENLRNQVIAMLEQANTEADPEARRKLLNFIIIGGGYTGVEAAGELTDLLRHILKFYPRIDAGDTCVTLLEASTKLLPELPEKMGEYSKQNLTRRGVQVLLGDGVASVDHDGLVLQSGRRLMSRTMVWSAGVKPTLLIGQLPLPRHKRGGVITKRDFSVLDQPGVWALGDCAAVPMDDKGGIYPATAQHAIREGPVLAGNLIAVLRGEPTKTFSYDSLGSMASLGARRGVAQVPGGFVVTGFLAWFIWRTYYLTRLPGNDRKLRVALDWFIGLFFPRDIAELRFSTSRLPRPKAADQSENSEHA